MNVEKKKNYTKPQLQWSSMILGVYGDYHQTPDDFEGNRSKSAGGGTIGDKHNRFAF